VCGRCIYIRPDSVLPHGFDGGRCASDLCGAVGLCVVVSGRQALGGVVRGRLDKVPIVIGRQDIGRIVRPASWRTIRKRMNGRGLNSRDQDNYEGEAYHILHNQTTDRRSEEK
jgi:hypothetical protein